jgi:hypothetical protein
VTDAGAAPSAERREALSALLERAAGRRGRVRLVYGSVPYVVEVLAFDGQRITGADQERGLLRFRLERVTEATELPSSDPLF